MSGATRGSLAVPASLRAVARATVWGGPALARAALAGAAALFAATAPTLAQDEGQSRPPHADEAPGDSRLADPEDRRDALEEIVVIGEPEWRLPDLGSSWRARQEAEPSTDRIEVSFLPVYDPESETVEFDALGINTEMQRVGFIELFRLRFGRR